MPRGVSDRDFVAMGSVDDERLTVFSKSMMGGAPMVHVNDLVDRNVASRGNFTRGNIRAYGFKIEEAPSEDQGCRVVFIEQIEPRGGIPVKLVNTEHVGKLRAKGIRGMFRALESRLESSYQTKTDNSTMAKQQKIVSFRENLCYRSELLMLLLDQLSRREHRVTRFVFLVDLAGVRMGHRKCFPYIGQTSNIGKITSFESSGYLVTSVSSVQLALWRNARPLLSEFSKRIPSF